MTFFRECSDWLLLPLCALLLLRPKSIKTDYGQIFMILVNMVRVSGGESRSMSLERSLVVRLSL